jgi:hypothetical protein
MPPRRTHVDYFNDCRQVPESLWVEEMTPKQKSHFHLYDERDYLQAYLNTHPLIDNPAIPHWILRNDVIEVVYRHPTLRIRCPEKNNVELEVFKSPESYQLRFIASSSDPSQFDLPSFNANLEWFKVGLQWLKTYLHFPPTTIQFPLDTLYTNQDSPAFKLNDAAPPGKKAEQTKRMKDWASDIPALFLKPVTPIVPVQKPSSTRASARVPPPAEEDAVLQGSPVVPRVSPVAPAAPAAPVRKPSSIRASDKDVVLQGSPVVPPKIQIPTIKLTTFDGKKILFNGQPILASITSQGSDATCIHTTHTNCFLIETLTTVKKHQLTLDVSPMNETLYKLLTSLTNPYGHETIQNIYILPSLSYILFEIAKTTQKSDRTQTKIFKYEKQGKKYNYIPMDKTIKHKK